MKGPIPDLKNPSPFGVLLRKKYAKSIADGNALRDKYREDSARALPHPGWPTDDVSITRHEFTEIQRQVQ